MIKTKTLSFLGVLLFVAQGSSQTPAALECYDCMHTESRYPGDTGSQLKCVDPVKGGADKVTCPNPNESCFIAVGSGSIGIYGELKVWRRQCYSVRGYYGYRDPQGCYNLYMRFNLRDNTINSLPTTLVSLREGNVAEETLKKGADLPQEDALNKFSSADGSGTGLNGTGASSGSGTSSNTSSGSGSSSGSGTRSGTGKQLGVMDVDIYGKFCICDKTNLCNKYEEAELEDTATKKGSKKTTTPLTEGTAVVNEAAPNVIFLLCTFAAVSWFVIKSRIYRFVVVL